MRVHLAQSGNGCFHPQTVIQEVKVNIEIAQRRPFGLKRIGRLAKRHPDLEHAIIVLEREQRRVTCKQQRGIVHLATLHCPTQIVRQAITHQRYREVAPGIARIGKPDTGQNIQTGFTTAILLIAEIPTRPERASLQVKVFTRQREAMFITQPPHRTGHALNL